MVGSVQSLFTEKRGHHFILVKISVIKQPSFCIHNPYGATMMCFVSTNQRDMSFAIRDLFVYMLATAPLSHFGSMNLFNIRPDVPAIVRLSTVRY